MIKKCLFYAAIAIVVGFISQGFKPLDTQGQEWFFVTDSNNVSNVLPSPEVTDYVRSDAPFTGKSFTGFKEAIAFKESQGQYKLVNSLGYIGKYQFGSSTLRAVGIHNNDHFLENPHLQEKAFIDLLTLNKKELQSEIKKFEGKCINNVLITESGILAAAHLGGAGSVKKFLNSNGKKIKKDAFGTSIISYLKKFSNYDTSCIHALSDK